MHSSPLARSRSFRSENVGNESRDYFLPPDERFAYRIRGMPIEIRLQSLDAARPNEALWKQIEAQQNDLVTFLQKEEPEVESAQIEPQAGFPTGLESFVIVIAIGFAKGVAEGAGQGVGRKLGARIRRWLETKFPDTKIFDVSEK